MGSLPTVFALSIDPPHGIRNLSHTFVLVVVLVLENAQTGSKDEEDGG